MLRLRMFKARRHFALINFLWGSKSAGSESGDQGSGLCRCEYDDILKKKIRKLDEIGSRFWKMMSLVSNIEIRSIQIP